MRKLLYIITLIVFVLSAIGLYSSIRDVIAVRGRFVWLRSLLSILGITAFVLFALKKRLFALLNIIWFMPQTIVLSMRVVDPMYDAYAERTIYDATIVISSVLIVSFEKTADVLLRVGFNLVGIVGLILSIIAAATILRRGNLSKRMGSNLDY